MTAGFVTFRTVLAAEIPSALSGPLQNKFAAALRALYADFFKERLCVAAFREARACQEFSVRTVFDDHVSSAVLADDVTDLILDLDFLKFSFCLPDSFVKIRIEVADNCLPLDQAICHAVQEHLEIGREIHIDNLWEFPAHNAVDNIAQLSDI